MGDVVVCVDLITPPGSPVHAPAQPSGVAVAGTAGASSSAAIELSPAPSPLRKRPAGESNQAEASARALGKRRAVPESGSAPTASTLDDDDDDDEMVCVEVERPQPEAPATKTGAGAEEDGDEDLQFVGRTGAIALSDFPHSRENCLERPWKPGTETNRCPNCFCYVCDAKAADCPEWASHAKATHTQPKWVQMRALWKTHGGKPPDASAPADRSAASSSASCLAPSAARLPQARRALSAAERERWSAEKFLSAICQVYPVESPDPPGWVKDAAMSLKPYQRQSLAFMRHIESSTDPSLVGTAALSGSRFGDTMCRRGGWLCDEMGMGKTAVCAALMCASKGTPTGGLTVVLVNNTLVGQWCDELKRFAPSLKVVKYYNNKPNVTYATDVVVTTPGIKPPEGSPMRSCTRLILDESHLYEPKSDPKLPSTKIVGKDTVYRPRFLWNVTGTPIATSLSGLEWQARMLGHWDTGLRLKRLCTGSSSFSKSNEEIKDTLQRLIIRHTKAQRINGEAALALPDADVETVWLEMSAAERTLYSLHACADGVPKWADANRMTALTLDDLGTGLQRRRKALAAVYEAPAVHGGSAYLGCSAHLLDNPTAGALRPAGCAAYRTFCKDDGTLRSASTRRRNSTKYAALLRDIEQLRAKQADVSIVTFTHYNEVLRELCEMLDEQGYTVFQVSRATDAGKRHSALRRFQQGAGSGGTRVFATTFSTAAVGLTLTAASRVYLLEASLNPAQEAQAAGRIHRLGQDKEVLVKRFFYKDSLDAAVADLHSKVKGGQIALEGGRFPPAALALLREHGVAEPHEIDEKAPQTQAQRRFRSNDKHNVAAYGGEGGFDYGKSVLTRPCKHCSKPVEVPGTSKWWGLGKFASLDNDTSDFPVILRDQECANCE